MIKVNGRDREWEENLTVELLLKKCKYTFPLIMVKVNGKYIPNKFFIIIDFNLVSVDD